MAQKKTWAVLFVFYFILFFTCVCVMRNNDLERYATSG